VFAAKVVGAQWVDGIPAGYVLNEQVSVHTLDPECCFGPLWRKVLADPAVEGVGLTPGTHFSQESANRRLRDG